MRFLLLTCTLLLMNDPTMSQTSDSLKIVSWNVFLRPAILKDKQLQRVDSIASSILEMDADVVVLQEVFHKRSRRRLIAALSDAYPYHSKMGKKTFWGVPSGNCLFSKDSIESEEFVYYEKAINADKMARKGAIGIRIKRRGRLFRIIGTHLQAGGGKEGARIRKTQIDQLDELSSTNEEITSFFAGDFNIKYQDTLYNYLTEKLQVQNIHPKYEKRGTANFDDHTLTNASGTSKWIDFILLRTSSGVKFSHSRIEEPRCRFKNESRRISDHNPIITVFHW